VVNLRAVTASAKCWPSARPDVHGQAVTIIFFLYTARAETICTYPRFNNPYNLVKAYLT